MLVGVGVFVGVAVLVGVGVLVGVFVGVAVLVGVGVLVGVLVGVGVFVGVLVAVGDGVLVKIETAKATALVVVAEGLTIGVAAPVGVDWVDPTSLARKIPRATTNVRPKAQSPRRERRCREKDEYKLLLHQKARLCRISCIASITCGHPGPRVPAQLYPEARKVQAADSAAERAAAIRSPRGGWL